ncbi:MAG: deoxyuridine 5-triphosphate nucleotidohydrolase [Actinomycetota bacterium]
MRMWHTGILSFVINVQFQRLDPRAIVPTYAHATDAGADLACLDDFSLKPGERKLVGTGIAIALPEGYVGLVHPRSGLANKNGISIVNAPGTIDADYRGEIYINLINLDPTETFHATAGSRIAQLVIQEFISANFTEVLELPDSVRGDKGHGSTGVKS